MRFFSVLKSRNLLIFIAAVDNPTKPASGTSSSNTGAIVGGVVGGIGGLVLIGLAWFFLRRHQTRRTRQRAGEHEPSQQWSELPDTQYNTPYNANTVPEGTGELDSMHRVELPATSPVRGGKSLGR